jgi:predicted lipase
MLTDISESRLLATQTLIDVYAQVLAQIDSSKAKQASNRSRNRRSKTQASCKRKRKRYRYARTQDFFRKNPNLQARYIREGISWLEEEDSSYLKQEDIISFYTTLLGTRQNITIPFSVTGPERIARNIGETFQAIMARDIKELIARSRHNTASGPDGMQRKHIIEKDVKGLMRILFNLILVRKIQPRAWNVNRKILIPKKGKKAVGPNIIDF